MADSNDIPTGTYTLTLGKTFDSPVKGRKSDQKQPANLHTLRYDFKPGSVSNEAETYIAFGQAGDVHVSVPSEGDTMTVYKGSKKEAKPKECLLFFDRNTNTVRLEKITSNINVKKTRDLDVGTEQALKRGIERLRTTSGHRYPSSSPERKSPVRPPPPPPSSAPAPPQSQNHTKRRESSDSSSDSDGSSDSDKSNVDSSDDEDESALLQQMNQKSQPSGSYSSSSISQQHHHHQETHSSYNNMPYGSSSSSKMDKGNSEKYGLALSESSDED